MEKLLIPLLLFVTVVNTFLSSLLVLRGFKNIFGLTFAGVTFWCLSILGFYTLNIPEINWVMLTHISALLLALSFLFFTYKFPFPLIKGKLYWYIPIVFFTLVTLLIIFTDSIVGKIINETYQIGYLYLLYVVIISAYFWGGFILLFLQLRVVKSELERQQIKYILAGSILSSGIATATDLILPFWGNYQYLWVGPAATIFLIASISIAIFRYRLFDIKVIVAEGSAILLLMVLLGDTFLSKTFQETLVKSVILLLITALSILLVRSVHKDVQSRIRIEGLVKDLAKANEHLRQIEQQKSEFVSIASHQLRTPLTAIKGYASMILEGSFGALSSEARGAVEKLFKSSQRLVSLVEDFLTVSRIERGKMQFDFTVLDAQKAVNEVVENIKLDARDKGIALTVQVEQNGGFKVRGDKQKLVQVFNNIIDNAIKFTTKGFVRVLIARDIDKRKIRIAVSDTGVGMEFNTIIRLFKRFDEELSSDRSKNTGMSPGGLGLYVSHQIVKAHGGNIWAQSEGLGKGSTFFIELPEA